MHGPFCEIMVKEILPVLRSLLAKRLSEFGLSQKKVAEKMGTTQPAVSQYKKGLRGSKTALLEDNREVLEKVDQIAKKLAAGQMAPQDVAFQFCEICEILGNDKAFLEKVTGKK